MTVIVNCMLMTLKLYSNYSNNNNCVATTQLLLDKLHAWSVKWQLSINYSKCRVLHLGHVNTKADYYINNVKIISERTVNDLGVLTDSDLKFNAHINSICAKAHARVSLLFLAFLSRDHHLLLLLIKYMFCLY